MNRAWDELARNWTVYVTPLAVLLLTLVAGHCVRRLLVRVLRSWAGRSRSTLDDLLIQSLYGPSLLWVVILAVHVATKTSAMPERVVLLIGQGLLILWIVSLTLAASRLVVLLLRRHGRGVATALPVTTLTQNIATLVIATLGMLMLLNTLGISVAPLLTALGIGGIAVALALQDTLSNLFAGFYVSLAGHVRIGDYVKLDSGDEGYVTDISWRSTTLRTLSNYTIVVPNAKVGQAILSNYHLPEKRLSVQVPVRVSYDCDPDHIERALTEEALAAAGRIPGLLPKPAPFVRLIPGFGEAGLDFTLICQVGEFADQYLVQHELRKRILRRFRRDGIEIPVTVASAGDARRAVSFRRPAS